MIIRKHLQGQTSRYKTPNLKIVEKTVKRVLQSENIKANGEINIIFVDNRLIKKLNRQFLGKNRTTDVIAFPYDQKKITTDDDPFGDVYISVPVARDNAVLYKQSIEKELIRLVVHGMLHILGYRDYKPKEKKVMWQKQEKLVEYLWLENK